MEKVRPVFAETNYHTSNYYLSRKAHKDVQCTVDTTLLVGGAHPAFCYGAMNPDCTAIKYFAARWV